MLKLLPVVTCCCLHLNILAWLVLCSEHSLTEAASRRRISKSIESNQQVRNKCLRTICPDILAAPVSTQTHCLLEVQVWHVLHYCEMLVAWLPHVPLFY